MVEERAEVLPGRNRLAGREVHEPVVHPVAGSLPQRGIEELGIGNERRGVRFRLLQRGDHERAGQCAEENGILRFQLDITGPQLEGGVVVGQARDPGEDTPVEDGAGGAEARDAPLVVRGIREVGRNPPALPSGGNG